MKMSTDSFTEFLYYRRNHSLVDSAWNGSISCDSYTLWKSCGYGRIENIKKSIWYLLEAKQVNSRQKSWSPTRRGRSTVNLSNRKLNFGTDSYFVFKKSKLGASWSESNNYWSNFLYFIWSSLVYQKTQQISRTSISSRFPRSWTFPSPWLVTDQSDTTPVPHYYLGSLKQHTNFAEAFQCPAESKMNPSERCTIWG